MVVCADTSFLFSLYGNDAHTSKAVSWCSTYGLPIAITSLNTYELGNALRFAEYRKRLVAGSAEEILDLFKEDVEAGRLIMQTPNLAQVIRRASQLSARYTLSGGHRSFDILHIAGALELEATHFLSFDANQSTLARTLGLRLDL